MKTSKTYLKFNRLNIVNRSISFVISIFFKRFDPIEKISNNYSDVAIGKRLCFFNSAGCLEIAINMGKASSLLGLNIDDSVQIDFQ